MSEFKSYKKSIVDLSMVSHIIDKKSIHTQYQPIISVKNNKIIAYEALARFLYEGIPIAPDKVFGICHNNLLIFFQLESLVKEHQFKNRVEDKTLFINFDLHILQLKQKVKTFFNFMAKQSDFVIEIVENSHESINIERLIDIFTKINYQFAVDDFLKENSIISLYLLNRCHYLKLDKDLLSQMRNDEAFIEVTKGICRYAHKLDKEVILEGIESNDDLMIAKECEVDLVQGYLYGDRFVTR